MVSKAGEKRKRYVITTGPNECRKLCVTRSEILSARYFNSIMDWIRLIHCVII